LFNHASRARIAVLASARLVNRSWRRLARIHRSAICTPTSTLALSRGLFERAGSTALP
jgi:hypothetical protein